MISSRPFSSHSEKGKDNPVIDDESFLEDEQSYEGERQRVKDLIGSI